MEKGRLSHRIEPVKVVLDAFGMPPQRGGVVTRGIVAACCLVMAGVLLRAGVPKAFQPEEFALAVYRYQFLPDALINAVALFVPWLEILCAVALLFVPALRKGAGWLVAGMLVAFTVLLVSAIFRGIDASCGCFSLNPDAQHLGWRNVIRNGVFLLLTGVVLWGHYQSPSSDPADGVSGNP